MAVLQAQASLAITAKVIFITSFRMVLSMLLPKQIVIYL